MTDKSQQPRHLIKGAKTFVSIIEKITGTHIKPIHYAYILNEDCSSQHYCAGTSIDSKNNTKLARVEIQSMLDCKNNSIRRSEDTENTTYKGIWSILHVEEVVVDFCIIL